MTGRSGLFTISILLASIAGAPAEARAQGKNDAAAAEALFKEGKRLMSAGQFAAACPKFLESQRLDPGIGTMLWLGDCHAKNGQVASAWAVFHEAEALAAKQKDPRVSVAREEAQKLEPRMSKVVLDITDVADISDLDIKRDGVSLGRPLWGTPIPTDGGSHVITAASLNKRTWQTTISVPVEHGLVNVRIPRLVEEEPVSAPPVTQKPETPPPLPAADDSQRGRTQRILGLAAGGIGLVAIGLGSWFGLTVGSKNDDSKPHCDPQNRCDTTGYELRNDALDLATYADVAFVLGGAAIVGGAVLYFTAPKAGAAASIDRSAGSRIMVGGGPARGGGAAFVTARF